MIINVEPMILIWQWLKSEIRRIIPYNGRCDYFYHHCRPTELSGKRADYVDQLRQTMTRIFLGLANERGRSQFDEAYPLLTEIKIPITYYKSHTPLAWGESQLDVLEEITYIKKPFELSWSPNGSHKGAKAVYRYAFCFDVDQFYWIASYDYMKDLSASWHIVIKPKPKQMLLDFMLEVRAWIRGGLKRRDLQPIGDRFSNRYQVIREARTKCAVFG